MDGNLENEPINSIEEIDRAIVDLVQQRIEHLRHAGSREQSAGDVADNERLRLLIRHIDSLCHAEIAPMRSLFLGPEFSYTHLAAIKYFGDAAPLNPVSTIADVFDGVVRSQASRGVVPIENSTDGGIVDTLSMFVRNPVKICGEVLLPIHHCLLGRCELGEITEIYSKPQAISQCRGWLAKHLPGVELKEARSTTAAAQMAAEQETVAAIASEAAGTRYRLRVIAANIEDNLHNVTRFAVLGNEEPDPTGNDKTSLLFQVVHRPGALGDVMNVFKQHELNLTWIESYPMPAKPNEYLFFVELDGHKDELSASGVWTDLESIVQRCDVLGSYPKGSTA